MLRQLRGVLFHVKSERMVSAIPVRWTRITKKIALTIVHIFYTRNPCNVPHSYIVNKIQARKLLLLTNSVQWGINELCCPLAYRDISLPFLNLEFNYQVYRSLPSNAFVKILNRVQIFALCLSKVKSNIAD